MNTPLFDREDMTDDEKALFVSDIEAVCRQYFEGSAKYSADVARTEKGFSVCILFEADRIKRTKRPLK